MIRYENECVGCEICKFPGTCSWLKVPHFYCDDCGCEEETLHILDGRELCDTCIIGSLPEVIA